MPLSYRERVLGSGKILAPAAHIFLYGVIDDTRPDVYYPDPSTQITGSENHERDRSGRFLAGGPFYTSRIKLDKSFSQVKVIVPAFPGAEYHYSGPQFPGDPAIWLADFTSNFGRRSTDLSDLNQDGTRAVAICSPVNPVDQVGRGLTENYRDGLPSIPLVQSWKERLSVIKAAGSEFLNVEFGWDPLVSEIKAFASTVQKSRDILKQYHENSGTDVRRTFHFPIDTVTDEKSIASGANNYLGGLGGGVSDSEGTVWETTGDAEIIRTVTQRVSKWFSGSFTYTVPSQTDTWLGAIQQGSDADKLFGTALTPDVLWDLAPWSWAVDWFSNVGDVLTNISNFSSAGQVMRYGYMMEHSSKVVTYTLDKSTFFIRGRGLLPVPTVTFINESKVRTPANPYGFGVSLESLSPLQIAIAAAVGISLL